MGHILELIKEDGRMFFRCGECDHLLGPSSENWKQHAARNLVSPDAAGPLIRLHRDLELRQFSCPSCGTQLSLDVAHKSDPDLFDIEI